MRFLLVLSLAACGFAAAPAKGPGCTTAFVIDQDCDGYGVGSPLGPDADDTDRAVNTAASAIAKYGTLDRLLAHLHYAPARMLFIATTGNDRSGKPNDPTYPFATFQHVNGMLRAGDAVIWRAGTYYERIVPGRGGSPGKPILFMAYPGEKVVIDHKVSSDSFNATSFGHWVIDGLVLQNTFNRMGYGIIASNTVDAVMRHIEIRDHYCGMLMMNGLHQVTLEYSSVHDINPGGTHAVYFGSRELPNTDITVRGNLIYRAGESGHGFQHNGRVTNLVVEDNVIHSNPTACISLLEGVSKSLVQNNVCYNNRRSGVIFWNYRSTERTIREYDQNYNIIRNNTFYINGRDEKSGVDPETPAVFVSQERSGGPPNDLCHNTYEGNIFYVATGAPVLEYRVPGCIETDTYRQNVLYTSGSTVVRLLGAGRDWKAFQPGPNVSENRFADPLFAAANPAWNKEPDRFDFHLRQGSSAMGIAAGGEAGAYGRQRPVRSQ